VTLNQVINIVIRVVIVRVVNAVINAGLRAVQRVRWRRVTPDTGSPSDAAMEADGDTRRAVHRAPGKRSDGG
jgi:hypothetical protein